MGWFFGLKLHIIINDKGELMAFKVTAGNTDDRVPVEKMTQVLEGSLIGDKGYLSKELFDKLYVSLWDWDNTLAFRRTL